MVKQGLSLLLQIIGWIIFWILFITFIFFKFYESLLAVICSILDKSGIWVEDYMIKQIWRD